MSPPIIIANRYIEELCQALGIRPERTARIIIDAKAGELVRLYVTQFGDEDLLRLTPPEVAPPEIEAA